MAPLSRFHKSILIKLSFIVSLASTLTQHAVGLWAYRIPNAVIRRGRIARTIMLAGRPALPSVKIARDDDRDLADNTLTCRHEGTDPGLAICRCQVKRSETMIAARINPGRGSCFTFTVVM